MDEYGQFSSDRDWLPVQLFHQIISKKSTQPNSKNSLPYHVISIGLNESYEKSENTTIINLEDILQEAFSESKK